ncbi:MAG: hypothetical protein KGI78_02355 [Patescibacteria group bacterium]|nr:hypothetical protein [Patescibacteria group bacterium]MDE1945139.1 hypothetical protein [Patescibacteria group bacterium]MDE2057674.1 hypothetical protein [Patescibacteria group bacterium]
MFSTKKYLPVLAAFAVGVIGAAGYAVHAASVTPSASSSAQVQTTAQDPANADGETADDVGAQAQTSAQDPQQKDGEQADDATTGASVNVQHEAESGPADSGPDQGETSN